MLAESGRRRSRQRGGHRGPAAGGEESGPHRGDDRRGGRRAAGQGARPVAVRPDRGLRHPRASAATATSRRPGRDVFVVTAGIARKPGMSRDDLTKTNAGIVRSVCEQIARVAPEVHRGHGLQPARRDVLRRDEGHRLPAGAGARHGGGARHGALPHVPRRGDERLGRGHPGHGARRPRRHHGAAGELHDRLRDPGEPAARAGEARRDRGPHPQRWRGDRRASSRPARPTTRPARRRSRWWRRSRSTGSACCRARAWLQGEFGLTRRVLRRALQARPRRPRADRRHHADRPGAGGPAQVGRGGSRRCRRWSTAEGGR